MHPGAPFVGLIGPARILPAAGPRLFNPFVVPAFGELPGAQIVFAQAFAHEHLSARRVALFVRDEHVAPRLQRPDARLVPHERRHLELDAAIFPQLFDQPFGLAQRQLGQSLQLDAVQLLLHPQAIHLAHHLCHGLVEVGILHQHGDVGHQAGHFVQAQRHLAFAKAPIPTGLHHHPAVGPLVLRGQFHLALQRLVQPVAHHPVNHPARHGRRRRVAHLRALGLGQRPPEGVHEDVHVIGDDVVGQQHPLVAGALPRLRLEVARAMLAAVPRLVLPQGKADALGIVKAVEGAAGRAAPLEGLRKFGQPRLVWIEHLGR